MTTGYPFHSQSWLEPWSDCRFRTYVVALTPDCLTDTAMNGMALRALAKLTRSVAEIAQWRHVRLRHEERRERVLDMRVEALAEMTREPPTDPSRRIAARRLQVAARRRARAIRKAAVWIQAKARTWLLLMRMARPTISKLPSAPSDEPTIVPDVHSPNLPLFVDNPALNEHMRNLNDCLNDHMRNLCWIVGTFGTIQAGALISISSCACGLLGQAAAATRQMEPLMQQIGAEACKVGLNVLRDPCQSRKLFRIFQALARMESAGKR